MFTARCDMPSRWEKAEVTKVCSLPSARAAAETTKCLRAKVGFTCHRAYIPTLRAMRE